jgi:GH25 family lysozyme M1 (1,4-beta-N-acetylmuramidase)
VRALAFAGVDISFYQRAIDLTGYADAYELIVIKASEGATITDPSFYRFEAETRNVKYRGFYHFLTHADPVLQIARFVQTIRSVYRPDGPDFLVIDWESSGGSQVPREIAYAVLEGVQRLFPEKPVWVYSYRSILFREAAYLHPYPMWVASYDVLEDAQRLGAVIDQYGIADSLHPFYGGDIDVNRVLDPDRLHELIYGSTPAPTEPEDDMGPVKYHDDGNRANPEQETTPEAALGWAADSATAARIYAQSAAATSAQILAAVQALPAPSTPDVRSISTQALLAELARRVTS